MWSFVGLLILFFVRTRDTAWYFSWSCRLTVVVSILFMAFTIGQNLLAPRFGLIYQTHHPYQPIALAVDKEWRRNFQGPVPIIASDNMFLMASVSWYTPGRPTTSMLKGKHETPWAEDPELNQKGGVILWHIVDGRDEMPANLRERFPRAIIVAPVEEHYHSANKVMRVGVALVPPLAAKSGE